MENLEGGLVGNEDSEEEFYSTDLFLNSIKEASKEVEALEAMRVVFEKYQKVDPQAIKIANRTIENLMVKFDLPRKGYALESYSTRAEVLESLGSSISVVITAIIATFKAIWNAIVSLLGGDSKKTTEEKVHKSVDKAKTMAKEKYVPKNPLVETPILSMLDFSDEVVTVKDIQERTHKKVADMQLLVKTEENAVTLSKKSLDSMKTFMSTPVGTEALDAFLKDGVFDFRDYQYNVKANMHNDLDMDGLKTQIESFESIHGITDAKRKTYSYLSPFLDNTVVVLCEVIDDSISYYHGTFTYNKVNTGVKLEMPNVHDMAAALTGIDENICKMFDLMDKKNKAIKNSSFSDIVENIPKFMKFVEVNYPDNASSIIKPFRVFAATYKEAAKVTKIFEKTARDYASLVEFITHNYVAE